MHRGIPHPNQPDRCPRCGGRPAQGQPAARQERACTCWDPLVEWLMDRDERR